MDHIDDPVVLTLVDVLTVETMATSLAFGASGAIEVDISETDVTLVIQAAMARRTLIPISVAQKLAKPSDSGLVPEVLDQQEIAWLQALASGSTTYELARDSGFSEREMYRRLRRVYRRLGAGNRYGALTRASYWGLIDPPNHA